MVEHVGGCRIGIATMARQAYRKPQMACKLHDMAANSSDTSKAIRKLQVEGHVSLDAFWGHVVDTNARERPVRVVPVVIHGLHE